jgi:DNA-binding response OmpR family regulator
MPTRSKPGRPWESTVGSGQFGTPRERTHWLNLRMPLSSSGTSAAGNWSPVPAGSRCSQSFWAAWYWELLTPSCCAAGNFALLAFGWAGRIAQGLRQAGMAVDAVHDGVAALDAAAQTAYDVIVLDRDLPAVHGDRVCRTLAGGGPRILMLTAAAGVDDRVDGLELGADDYLPKPFAFAELVARVRALSRRAPSGPPVLRRGDLAVDLARHRASRGCRTLSLTRKEFGILEMLLAADGAVVSAEELLEHVWDAHADPFSNIVSVTMARLRRKLGEPPLIETVVGKGYRM